jgi:hypothetical protein
MTRSIESHLRSAANAIEAPGELPRGLMARIERRRRRRRALASASAVTLTAIAVAATILVVDRSSSAVQQVAINHPNAHLVASSPGSPSMAATSPPASTVLPALGKAPAPSPAPEPSTFYGAVGAGDERLAIVDSRTGMVRRYLQQQGSQELEVFSPDRTTAYQPSLNIKQCDDTWTQTNLRTGAQSPAFTDLDRPLEVALSPVGGRIAYVSASRPATPGNCSTVSTTLVVTPGTGSPDLRIPLGQFVEPALYPAFDDSGNLLAIKCRGHIRVLDLRHDTSIGQAAVVPTPAGCDPSAPMFRPGNDQLLVSDDCSSYTGIDGFAAGSWRHDYRLVATREPLSFMASFAVDASGEHLIYAVDIGNGPDQGAVFVARPGADRHVTNGIYQVFW